MTMLVPTFQVILSLLWICLVGWAIARPFTRDLETAERLARGFACALLLRAIIYAALLALGANPGPGKLLGIELIVLVGSLLAGRNKGPGIPSRSRIAILPGLLLVLAGLTILMGAMRLLSQPLSATDYLAVWGLKAKTIYFSGGAPGRLFDDPLTSGATRSIRCWSRSRWRLWRSRSDSSTIARSVSSIRRSNWRRRLRSSDSCGGELASLPAR